MRRLSFLAIVLMTCVAFAQDEKKPPLPASRETAADALKNSPRHGEWVDIALPGSETKIHTFVVYPERKEKAPVVIVIHEIFGMTDWVRAVADQFAAEGFIAVAPDLLSGKGPNGGNTDSFAEGKAGDAIRNLKADEYVPRLDAVRDYAIKLEAANGKSGSVGFCWGGAASFTYATKQPGLNAAVVYYGRGPGEAKDVADVKAPVLGLYGSDDARVNQTLEATEKAMKESDKPFTKHIYEGAGHGFLRQQSEKNNKPAAEQAWKETVSFFKKHLES